MQKINFPDKSEIRPETVFIENKYRKRSQIGGFDTNWNREPFENDEGTEPGNNRRPFYGSSQTSKGPRLGESRVDFS